jgi:hypothetical protein
MTDELGDLLRALPGPTLDHSLDQLEPAVWRRIDAMRAPRPTAARAWAYQLAAAGMALAIGLALGWSAAGPRQADQDQGLYASYAGSGPDARLSGL